MTASEFKTAYDDNGHSFRPYKCPFCEAAYEDRCIITECVRAPHFKLPDSTKHLNGCTGEAYEAADVTVVGQPAAPKKTVVGGIEIPQALVKRRKPSTVRKPDDDGTGGPPDAVEVLRRRKLIGADKTISSCYTASQIRDIVEAFKRLGKHASKVATDAKLKPGTTEYNASFSKTLRNHALSLYGQKLNYSNAFQSHKLKPGASERVYHGKGRVATNAGVLTIADANTWPRQQGDKTDQVAFVIKIKTTLDANASTSHKRAMGELIKLAAASSLIEWHAYGKPLLLNERFELIVDSLDNLYWSGQHK